MRVFIPSKGRPSCKTAKLLPGATIFVEPQDLQSYKDSGHKRIVVLPENDKGMVYVRNFILEYSRQFEDEYFAMVDDDIAHFNYLLNGKIHRVPAEQFLWIVGEEVKKLHGRGIIGLQYGQFMAEGYTNFTHCDVFVVVAKELVELGARYDKNLKLKVDRDFAMQSISLGKAVTRINFLGFNCPANGSNAGGLKSVYAKQGIEAEACRVFKEKWSKAGYCEVIVKKTGRIDLKVNYKALAKDKGFKV